MHKHVYIHRLMFVYIFMGLFFADYFMVIFYVCVCTFTHCNYVCIGISNVILPFQVLLLTKIYLWNIRRNFSRTITSWLHIKMNHFRMSNKCCWVGQTCQVLHISCGLNYSNLPQNLQALSTV